MRKKNRKKNGKRGRGGERTTTSFLWCLGGGKQRQTMEEEDTSWSTIYRQCIDTLFSRWTALGLALDHWNRPAEECRQLVDTLQQAILQAAQDNQLCTDFLETLFEETFDILQVDIEDGSIEEVASLLCTMFQDCLQGNRESLNKFLKPRSTISNPLVQHDDNCNSQVNQPPKSHYMSSSSLTCGQVPESSDGQVDEDGFQRVQRRRPHNSTFSISTSNK